MIYYGCKSVAKLAFYSKVDNSLFAYFPFGNSMTLSVTGDNVEALANGTTIINWQANRKSTLQLESQVISQKLLTIILGATNSTVASGTMAQYESGVTSTTSTFTLAATPSTSTLSLFLTEADGATVISELTSVGSAPSDTQYSISGKDITVSAGNASKNILAIYAKDGTNIDLVTIKANEFSQAFKITGIGIIKAVDGVEHIQEINIPSATAQSSMDFTYSSDTPSSFSFTFDLAADPVTQELFSLKTL
jgi:hypothetical protein